MLTARIRAAGIPLDRTGLAPLASGADNTVFTAQTIDGHHLIVKASLRPNPRYATAAWAAAALTAQGIPAPRILWHDRWDGGTACVETRCPGNPLTGTPDQLDTTDAAISESAVRAARHAGTLLHLAHAITVGGYGKLTPQGTGPHRSLTTSILPDLTARASVDPSGGLATCARRLISANLWRLPDPGPHLLVGDCAARHIFHHPGTGRVTGFIDLESARGGDPLADLAGFSVREHPDLVRPLLESYFPDGATVDQIWALTLHRARIATHLMLFHLTRGQYRPAERLTEHVTADIRAISTETPTAMPAPLPFRHSAEPSSPH
ncbi:phosphotransferase [Actinomadura sp. 6K520]|uniref:phosphotransferase family protein n=1 Tax=Actinomadura sp. 6K520 TaxID=2530364 RepID=UPI001404D3C3|nr:phosphotransferase [Actinomadura sp. 6K520]